MSSTAQSVTAVNWWMLPPVEGNMTAGAWVGATTSSSTSFAIDNPCGDKLWLGCCVLAQSYDRTCKWPYNTLHCCKLRCRWELHDTRFAVLQESHMEPDMCVCALS